MVINHHEDDYQHEYIKNYKRSKDNLINTIGHNQSTHQAKTPNTLGRLDNNQSIQETESHKSESSHKDKKTNQLCLAKPV